MLASRTFQKEDVIGAYYGTLLYHDFSSRKHTRKVYGDGILKVDMARFPNYALQLKVQGRGLKGVKERVCRAKACAPISHFSVLALVLPTIATPRRNKTTKNTELASS